MKKFKKLKKYFKNIFEITMFIIGMITVVINLICTFICIILIVLFFLVIVFFALIPILICSPLLESIAFYFFDIKCSIIETLRNAKFKRMRYQEWMAFDEICLSVSEKILCKENNKFKMLVLQTSCKIILNDLVKELIVEEDIVPKSLLKPYIKIVVYRLQNDHYTPRKRRAIKRLNKKENPNEAWAPV